MSEPLSIFVACAPGLEQVLVDEIAELAIAGAVTPTRGGVELAANLDAAYRCNLELGVGSRVLVRLGEFRARGWRELIDGVANLPWGPWVDRDSRLAIKATATKSKLYHTGGIAQRVQQGIEANLGGELLDGPVASIMVRLVRDHCTVSVDTTGELLSRRGYRLATGKAPLREDLARALVRCSDWDRVSPLVDPFCGSGTIAIEAALLAGRRVLGADRQFAFMSAPGFESATWQRLVDEARNRERAELPPISASDRDAGVIELARGNAARAAVTVELHHAPVSRAPGLASCPPDGALVTNPPYGGRVSGNKDLRPLYQRLGALVRERIPDWRIALVVDRPALANATGLRLASALMTDHGGRKVYFMISSAHASTAADA